MRTVTSCWADLHGPVHYVDFGGPPSAPAMVLVHGLGGSYANWVSVAPLFAERFRVWAVDLPGFGLSPVAGRPATVTANGDLMGAFVRTVVGGPAVWVGNSMGALICLMQVEAHPEWARAAVLIDLSLLPRPRHRPHPAVSAAFGAYFVPGLGRATVAARKALRTSEEGARDMLAFVCRDHSQITPQVMAEHVGVLEARRRKPGLARQFELTARSLLHTLRRRRVLAERARRVRVPVLQIHGDRDPLVPIRTAQDFAVEHPGWRLAVMEGLGHLPMLEAPRRTADLVAEWWAGVDPPR